MALGFKSFSAGERRGMIALLTILSIIVAITYVSMRSVNKTNMLEIIPIDTVIINNLSQMKDSANTIKIKQKQYNKKTKPDIKPRDPLSQPVPQL